MFRKCIILFLALILFSGSAFAQDYHLDVEVTVCEGNDSRNISLNVLFRSKELLLLSSLFPSFAVSVPDNTGTLNPDDINSLFSSEMPPVYISVDHAGFFKKYSEYITEPERKGFFSGDLFDNAKTVKSATFSLGELLDFIRTDHGSGDMAESFLG